MSKWYTGFKITSVVDSDRPKTEFTVDSVPERNVILRAFIRSNQIYDSFELSPEEAMGLGEDLIEMARNIMVRNVMRS